MDPDNVKQPYVPLTAEELRQNKAASDRKYRATHPDANRKIKAQNRARGKQRNLADAIDGAVTYD